MTPVDINQYPPPRSGTGHVHMVQGVAGDWHVSWQSAPDEPEAFVPGPEGLGFDAALEWARDQPAKAIIIHNHVD